MEDRFKYKIYNTTKKVFLKENLLDYVLCSNGNISHHQNRNSTEFYISVADLIPVFCTGLKDKTGQLIYEGDIVQNYALRDVVIFEKGIFTTKGSAVGRFGIRQPLAVHNELEIIGNKFENPELLEGVKDE